MSGKKRRAFAGQQKIVQGWRPKPDLPSFARELSKDEHDGMQNEFDVALSEYHASNGHEMPPAEILQTCHEINLRWRTGVAPIDLRMGEIQGGPLKGVKLAKDQRGRPLAGLARNELNRPLRVQLKAEDEKGFSVKLAGVSTGMGNTTGDRALIEAVSDTNIFGGTTGLLPPAIYDEILVKWSRSPAFLPLAKIGLLPALTWEQIAELTTIYDELFEGTNLRTLKAAIVPRLEGAAGGPTLVPTFDKWGHVVSHNYMWHSKYSWESLIAMRGSFIGVQSRAQRLLGKAPLAVQDYNLIQSFFWALEVGYQRRWETSGPSWEVATGEIPFGKAEFITSNAYKHQAYWNPETGSIYNPSADANYRKYHSSTAVGSAVQTELKSVYGANNNKILEVLLFMAGRMREKGENLTVVMFPHWLLEMYGMSDKAQNRLYAPTSSPRFRGAAGYVGTLPLVGFGEPVDVITYDAGSLPAFATTDTSPITLDGLIIGFDSAKPPVTLMPFISPTLLVSPEYDTSGATSVPTGRDVVSLFHSECVEAYDMRPTFMVKIVPVAHQ